MRGVKQWCILGQWCEALHTQPMAPSIPQCRIPLTQASTQTLKSKEAEETSCCNFPDYISQTLSDFVLCPCGFRQYFMMTTYWRHGGEGTGLIVGGCGVKKHHWTLSTSTLLYVGVWKLNLGKTNILQQKRNPKVMCSM